MKTIKQTIEFKLHKETELPHIFIESVPHSGRADEAIEELLQDYNIECYEQDVRKYLKHFGAWSESELENHEDNLKRLVWLACLECRENETNFFYMGS